MGAVDSMGVVDEGSDTCGGSGLDGSSVESVKRVRRVVVGCVDGSRSRWRLRALCWFRLLLIAVMVGGRGEVLLIRWRRLRGWLRVWECCTSCGGSGINRSGSEVRDAVRS